MVRRNTTRSAWLSFAAALALVLSSGCSTVVDRFWTSEQPRGHRERQASGATDRRPASALELMPPADLNSFRKTVNGPRPQVSGDIEHVSPDGRWVATESGKGAARALSVGPRAAKERRRISGALPATPPSWAPDSRRLAFAAREFRDPDFWAVWVFDVAAARSVRLGSAGGPRPPSVAWFPDGDRVCYGNQDRLVLVNVVTRETSVLEVPEHGRVAGTPAVSPDGRQVVFAVAGDGAWVASVEDGHFSRLVTDQDVDALAWAPGGHEVALRTASDGRWQVRVVHK